MWGDILISGFPNLCSILRHDVSSHCDPACDDNTLSTVEGSVCVNDRRCDFSELDWTPTVRTHANLWRGTLSVAAVTYSILRLNTASMCLCYFWGWEGAIPVPFPVAVHEC